MIIHQKAQRFLHIHGLTAPFASMCESICVDHDHQAWLNWNFRDQRADITRYAKGDAFFVTAVDLISTADEHGRWIITGQHNSSAVQVHRGDVKGADDLA